MKLSKKNRLNAGENRQIQLLPCNDYRSIIVIINKAEQIQHNVLHHAFPAAEFSFLSTRNQRTDDSSGYNYTLHPSDIRLGVVRNERLKNLLNSKYDLLIDLSNHSKLGRFSQKISAQLKAGCFDRQNNYNFDILVKQQDSSKEIVNNIAKQIDKLTLNKKE